MAQSPNQFVQSLEKGMLDLKMFAATLSVIVDSSCVPGQAVKLVTGTPAGSIPHVTAVTAASDDVFGFITYDLRRSSLNAGDRTEIAFFRGNVMYMEAAAAVPVGSKVAVSLSGSRVAVAVTGNMIVGRALDGAAAIGSIFRVLIDCPGTLAP